MRSSTYMICLPLAVLALSACSKPSHQMSNDSAKPASATPAVAMGDFKNPMSAKPGLWQINTDVAEMKTGKIATTLCVDAATGERWTKMAGQVSGHDIECPKRDIVKTPTGATIDQVCTTQGRTVTSHIDYTVVSDTEFKEVVKSTFSPEVAGHAGNTVAIDAVWQGACPANMKAGDIQVKIPGMGTQVINMDAAMARAKAMKAP